MTLIRLAGALSEEAGASRLARDFLLVSKAESSNESADSALSKVKQEGFLLGSGVVGTGGGARRCLGETEKMLLEELKAAGAVAGGTI
jgi:hypothetical protein